MRTFILGLYWRPVSSLGVSRKYWALDTWHEVRTSSSHTSLSLKTNCNLLEKIFDLPLVPGIHALVDLVHAAEGDGGELLQGELQVVMLMSRSRIKAMPMLPFYC